jgi:hypothetical protein
LRLTSGRSGVVGVGAVLVFVAVGVCVVAYGNLSMRGVVVIAVLLLLYVDWVSWLVGLCITKRCKWSVDW